MSLRSIRKRTDWEQMIKEIDALMTRLRQKPNKLYYQCSPGGILDAYRKGDLSFKEAVKALEDWKDRKIKEVHRLKPGTVVMVKVDGKPYETIIEDDGVQRFRANSLFKAMYDDDIIDLNLLSVAYQQKRFTKEEFLNFVIGLGYSVIGLSLDFEEFKNLKIENPIG